MADNLADLISGSADRSPAHVALIEGNRRTTYAGLDAAVSACASGLAQRGVTSGQRVAIMVGNRTEFVVAYYGALRLGAVAVPLNTSLTTEEVAHAVGACGASLVFVDSETHATVADAGLRGVPIIVVGGSGWEELLNRGRAERAEFPDTDPETLAVLLFTAGSTGRPKAAMLTHRAMLANTDSLLALDNPPAMTADDIVLGVLPLFHVYSLNSVLGLSMAAGATVVLEQRFSPRGSLELIRKHRVSVVGGAPPMYIAWSAEEGLSEALEPVRLLSSGSAPLPPAVFEQFATLAGRPVWEGYGLTECSPVVSTALVSGRPKAGAVGRPLPGVEVRLVDEAGDPVEDQAGEVYIRSASLFSGYWPDGSDGPDEDGWYGTGDVAFLDDEGDLHLIDRRKELILVSGFNVYPREVERVIQEFPGVAECAVIGVAHPYTGEAVKAFVAPMPGAALTPADIATHCQARLARFKCPTIVEITSGLPHTAAGKVARGALRERTQV